MVRMIIWGFSLFSFIQWFWVNPFINGLQYSEPQNASLRMFLFCHLWNLIFKRHSSFFLCSYFIFFAYMLRFPHTLYLLIQKAIPELCDDRANITRKQWYHVVFSKFLLLLEYRSSVLIFLSNIFFYDTLYFLGLRLNFCKLFFTSRNLSESRKTTSAKYI